MVRLPSSLPAEIWDQIVAEADGSCYPALRLTSRMLGEVVARSPKAVADAKDRLSIECQRHPLGLTLSDSKAFVDQVYGQMARQRTPLRSATFCHSIQRNNEKFLVTLREQRRPPTIKTSIFLYIDFLLLMERRNNAVIFALSVARVVTTVSSSPMAWSIHLALGLTLLLSHRYGSPPRRGPLHQQAALRCMLPTAIRLACCGGLALASTATDGQSPRGAWSGYFAFADICIAFDAVDGGATAFFAFLCFLTGPLSPQTVANFAEDFSAKRDRVLSDIASDLGTSISEEFQARGRADDYMLL